CWAYTFLLYVDDMIVTGDDSVGIESLKLELAHHFAIKDLGLLRFFPGIRNKMIEDNPIDAKAKYTPIDSDPMPDSSLYYTYRDFLCSSFCLSLCFCSHNGSLGCCFIDSQKQDVISRSSTEAEFRAMAVTTSEIVWLRWLLADMVVPISHFTPSHCDNRSAIQIALEFSSHDPCISSKLLAMTAIVPHSRKPHSNPMEMEMSESESVRIEIPSNQPGNNNNVVVKEWEGCLRGHETNKRKRYIQRVPPLLLHGVKRLRNHEYYEPAVVSLGPYHHKSTKLAHNPRRVPLEQRKNNEFLIQQGV
ncbi:uncharacterized mitochondrial protein-like protein, partial [Tanacetum coccineum]